jgi:hypothetical protein
MTVSRLVRWFRAPALLFALFTLRAAAAEFDHTHALLTGVLARHVKDARVDYAALQAQPAGLNRYLDQLAAVSQADFAKWSEPRRMAFLSNAYNAWTLKLVIDHYPVKSIKRIGGLFSSPWEQPVVRLFGGKLTLNTLEHGMLRVDYNEPRLHFALVCAAKGCPPLRAEAYVDTRLDEQLTDQARQFLATPDKNRVEAGARTVYLSPIFKWYGGDFEKKSGSVLAALKPYWPEKSAAALGKGDFKIRYTDYDWSLNAQSK